MGKGARFTAEKSLGGYPSTRIAIFRTYEGITGDSGMTAGPLGEEKITLSLKGSRDVECQGCHAADFRIIPCLRSGRALLDM